MGSILSVDPTFCHPSGVYKTGSLETGSGSAGKGENIIAGRADETISTSDVPMQMMDVGAKSQNLKK